MTKTQAPKAPQSKAKSPKKRDIKDVWIEYKKHKTEELRNILMENYLHLVRYNAERIHVKLPDEVELDDLMSAGIFGLMDAIAAFDLALHKMEQQIKKYKQKIQDHRRDRPINEIAEMESAEPEPEAE